MYKAGILNLYALLRMCPLVTSPYSFDIIVASTWFLDGKTFSL